MHPELLRGSVDQLQRCPLQRRNRA